MRSVRALALARPVGNRGTAAARPRARRRRAGWPEDHGLELLNVVPDVEMEIVKAAAIIVVAALVEDIRAGWSGCLQSLAEVENAEAAVRVAVGWADCIVGGAPVVKTRSCAVASPLAPAPAPALVLVPVRAHVYEHGLLDLSSYQQYGGVARDVVVAGQDYLFRQIRPRSRSESDVVDGRDMDVVIAAARDTQGLGFADEPPRSAAFGAAVRLTVLDGMMAAVPVHKGLAAISAMGQQTAPDESSVGPDGTFVAALDAVIVVVIVSKMKSLNASTE